MPRAKSPIGRVVQWGDDGQQFVKVGQPDKWQHYTAGGKHDANKGCTEMPKAEDLEKATTSHYLTPMCMGLRTRIAASRQDNS